MRKGIKLVADRFADVRVLRFLVVGFDKQPLKRKRLLYYLSQAALWGRDIFWHQNDAKGLRLRRLLECVYRHQKQVGRVDEHLAEYLKCVWFANGVHHHYSQDKFYPRFTTSELLAWCSEVPADVFLSDVGKTPDQAVDEVERLIFDASYHAKKVSLASDGDVIASSSVNFYSGVSQKEVEALYKSGEGRNALNSQVVKAADGSVHEEVWKLGGMYSAAIEKIIYWLGKARDVADNDAQADVIAKLISYYESGNLHDFDEYNKVWVAEKSGQVDFINGFIEVYDDPLGLKGTWESLVELVDTAATERIKRISDNAQWFEDNSPIKDEHRKKEVKGVSMNVVEAVMLGGDCYPATPIGVNLPNAEWIREQFGSKSISLSNITHSHHMASLGTGVLEEFAASLAEVERCRRFGMVADDLHTQLHECLGHGSGRMMEGKSLDDLKSYGSTIEEARADLFALYFMADNKMTELGITSTLETAWAHYDSYMRNGLIVQLARIEEGKDIEEAHMRNRHLVAQWALERGQRQGVVQFVSKDDKTYVHITSYPLLRELFGELLCEVQRIKSEGDYNAARDLVENYGVHVDPKLHHEVRQRYEALGVAPFSGFVNPRMEPIVEDGEIVDVVLHYDEAYDEQMLRYSSEYSALR